MVSNTLTLLDQYILLPHLIVFTCAIYIVMLIRMLMPFSTFRFWTKIVQTSRLKICSTHKHAVHTQYQSPLISRWKKIGKEIKRHRRRLKQICTMEDRKDNCQFNSVTRTRIEMKSSFFSKWLRFILWVLNLHMSGLADLRM